MRADRKGIPGVMLYFDDVRPVVRRLTDEQCGKLFKSVISYAESGELPDLDPITGMAFDLISPKIDRDAEKYEESREQRQYAVYCREKRRAGEPYKNIEEWRQSKANGVIGSISADNENNGSYLSVSVPVSVPVSVSESVSISASVSKEPPTLAEIKAFCDEEGLSFDPARFYNYYAARGWKTGKNIITDWKALARSWKGTGKGSSGKDDRDIANLLDKLDRI